MKVRQISPDSMLTEQIGQLMNDSRVSGRWNAHLEFCRSAPCWLSSTDRNIELAEVNYLYWQLKGIIL